MAGSKPDISEWVENFAGDLYSWALHKVSDHELARDLVQDTFLAAAGKIEGFKGESTPRTWLFSILNHKIIDHYRKKVKLPDKVDMHLFSEYFDEDGNWRIEKRPQNWEEEPHLLDIDEFQKVLRMCLDALPEKWGISVRLKYLVGKKGNEICQELDITPTNLWQIIHRAKLQLRECLEQNWFND